MAAEALLPTRALPGGAPDAAGDPGSIHRPVESRDPRCRRPRLAGLGESARWGRAAGTAGGALPRGCGQRRGLEVRAVAGAGSGPGAGGRGGPRAGRDLRGRAPGGAAGAVDAGGCSTDEAGECRCQTPRGLPAMRALRRGARGVRVASAKASFQLAAKVRLSGVDLRVAR